MVRKYSSISVETTLASGINSSATSMTVASGTGTTLMGGISLSSGDTFAVAIDPETSSEEIVYITAVASDTLTISRAQAGTGVTPGSVGVAHNAGATVQHVFTGNDAQHFEDGINNSVTATSTTTLSNKTLTEPKFVSGGFIADANGNEEIKFITTTGASNEITVTNATSSNAPSISATGGDTNINLNLLGKGTGTVQIGGLPVATARLTLNAQSGTTYTFAATDLNKLITTSNASAVTVTVPSGVFTAGDILSIAQLGDGQVTLADDGTSVLNSANSKKLRTKYSVASVICTASNTFLVIGDTA